MNGSATTKNSLKAGLLLSLALLAGCATGQSPVHDPTGKYVEIPNPGVTMSPNAPATIWVPATAEEGIPRGSVLIEEGVEKVKEEIKGRNAKPAASPAAPATAAAPAAAAPPATAATSAVPVAPAPVAAVTPVPVVIAAPAAPAVRPAAISPVAVKKQIAVFEAGSTGVIASFTDQVRGLGIAIPVEPGGTVAATEKERAALAGDLWKDNTSSVLVIVSAPDGVGPGKMLTADIYDGIEKSRLRRVSTQIPATAGTDRSALAVPCADLALRVGDVVNLTPWFGKVFAVDGDRIYVNAGREAGIQTAQKLKVYRGGKVIAGIGFDPGKEIATIEITGFIGTNGSSGVVKGGQSVNVGDVVSN